MDKKKFRALEQKLDCVPVYKLHTDLCKSAARMSNNSTYIDADLACLHAIACSNLAANLFCAEVQQNRGTFTTLRLQPHLTGSASQRPISSP